MQDADVNSYEWDFDGDGQTDATGPTTTHTYPSAGEYAATLTVTDDAGATDTETNTITVEPDRQDAGSVGIELQPGTAEVRSNGTHPVDVVATNVTDGIGAYNITIGLNNTAVATISDVSLYGGPISGGTTDIAADGSTVTFSGGSTDTKDTGEVTIATLALTTQSAGAVATTTTVKTIGNESASELTVTNITETTVTVTERGPPDLPAVVGDTPPSDTDSDGAFEDVNGDDAFNVNDVTALWANRNSDAIQNNSQSFDINSDGSFNVNDVTALWNEVTG
jgi:PKD repeat protein